MKDLIIKISDEIKKELGLQDSITPSLISFQDIVNELLNSKIDEYDYSTLLQRAKEEGFIAIGRLKVEPKEGSIYTLLPPIYLGSKDKILFRIFGDKERKIKTEDRDPLAAEILLAPYFFDFKMKRSLKHYPHIHYLNYLCDSLVHEILKGEWGVLDLTTNLMSLHSMFLRTKTTLQEAYLYRRIQQKFEKYYNILPSFALKNLSEKLNIEHLERYFEPFNIDLMIVGELLKINFQGKYKGEKKVRFKDFFEKKEIGDELLWLYGLKGKNPAYIL